jgi:flavin-dependent dehydrogenase
MSQNFDVIVVGARCAGSSLAMLLARRGVRVLLVDRARFPSDTLSGHNVQLAGTAALARWGLFETVARSGCPPVTQYFSCFGDFSLCGIPPRRASRDPAAALCVRRTVLDKILLDAAIAAGVEFRHSYSVSQLLWENDRVVGIEGSTPNTSASREHAAVVVGADGMRSFVARSVDAARYCETKPLTLLYYTYWEDVPPRDGCPTGVAEAESWWGYRVAEGWAAGSGMSVLSIATNDGVNIVSLSLPVEEFPWFKSNVEKNYSTCIAKTPLGQRLRSARRVERFYGTADLPNFFRRSCGPGWALVGDAGFFKDPIVGHGIADAFIWAEVLGDAIVKGLDGGTVDAEIAAYCALRDREAGPGFNLAVSAAHLRPITALNEGFMRAVAADPVEAGRYFGVVGAESVDPREFFSAQNIRSIMERHDRGTLRQMAI